LTHIFFISRQTLGGPFTSIRSLYKSFLTSPYLSEATPHLLILSPSLDLSWLYNLICSLRLIIVSTLFKKTRVVLVSCDSYSSICSFLLKILLRRVVWISTIHGIIGLTYRYHYPINYLIHLSANAITSPSLSLSEQFKNSFYDTSIKIVPNSIQVTTYKPLVRQQNQRICIFHLANFYSSVKGHDVTLLIADKLFQANLDFTIHLIGDGKYRSHYERLYHAQLPSSAFTFHGFRDLNYVRSLATTFSLGLNPSKSESFGISILELMNMSIPVIANNVGGTSELVQNGFNGFLVSSNSVHEYFYYICSIANDPSLYRHISINAFYTSLKYTPDSQYRAFDHVLKAVL